VTDAQIRQARYAEWLRAQGIRFGFDAEIAEMSQRVSKGIRNDTPPLERWHRIVPTIRVLELVRDRFGPTVIHSAYRSLAYNVAVGGVGDSRHSQNDAIDFSCKTGTPEDWARFLRDKRATGVFTGGIGVYPRSGFVHIDTRGTVADWSGK
jgi:N-acetylmuramoyl-L-alanine amidase